MMPEINRESNVILEYYCNDSIEGVDWQIQLRY